MTVIPIKASKTRFDGLQLATNDGRGISATTILSHPQRADSGY
jgi:hypothetical protein